MCIRDRYTVSTSSQILFYNPINVAGKTASTTTFVTYYTYEDNTITEIISTGSQKTLYLTEIIQPNQNYSHVKLQSYRIENGNENNIWEYVLPIQNITSSSVTVNFDGTLPDSYFRASLGKTLVNYRSNFIGSSNINVINTLKVNRVESFQSPRFSLLDKKVTVLRDLQPNNNFSSATYGQPKIKVAADKTFISTINITTTAAQVVFLEPVVISGNDLSTSTFVSTFINEYDILRSFNSTSSLITFYFNRTVGVTSDYTVARFTNFIWYDFTTTIVNVTSQSVTIVNPLTQPLPNGGLSAYLGKVWPGQTYRSITYDPALQIPNISTTKIKFNLGTLTSLEIPRQGKVQSSTVLRSDVAVNRFLTNIFKNIPQVRGERNSDPH
ncbi:hypothetical protein EBU71_21595, partial [bacterium]|nr:hypothetical protein [Candidatus Elulimicrobium humile]